MRRENLRTCLAVTAAAAAMALLAAAPANATSDHYFSGGLSPSRAYASYSQHDHIYYSQAVAVHTHCAGIADPFFTAGGYFYETSGSIFGAHYTCGTGTVSRSWSGSGTGNTYRGLTWNPTQATNVSVSDAHYSWN